MLNLLFSASVGLSGRSLRKLPMLFHAEYLPVSITLETTALCRELSRQIYSVGAAKCIIHCDLCQYVL